MRISAEYALALVYNNNLKKAILYLNKVVKLCNSYNKDRDKNAWEIPYYEAII